MRKYSHTIESKLQETTPFGSMSNPVSTEFVKLFSNWEHIICWFYLKFQGSSYNKLSRAVLVQPLFKQAVWLIILLKKLGLSNNLLKLLSISWHDEGAIQLTENTHMRWRLCGHCLFQVSQLTFYCIFLSLCSKLELFSMRALRKWLSDKFLCWKRIEKILYPRIS